MIKLKNAALLRDACLVNGRWLKAADGKTIAVENPANSMIIGHVPPSLSADEVEAAVESAGRAFFRVEPPCGTAPYCVDGLISWWRTDDLGALMTAEQGKPFAEAKGEALYAASFVEWFGGSQTCLWHDTIPSPTTDKRITILKQADRRLRRRSRHGTSRPR